MSDSVNSGSSVATPTATFVDTPLTSPISEFALPLVARAPDGEWSPSGTAFVIGPYLALTAWHVVSDFWQRYGGDDGREANAHFALQAFQVVEGGRCGVLWNITRLWYSGAGDLAVLRLTPTCEQAASYVWRCAVLRLVPPAIGEKLHAFGYRDSMISVRELAEDHLEVTWRDKPTTSHGVVTDRHLFGRDRCRLPWPVIETDARFDGGMSGGPVMTDDGRLCGLVCSNLPPATPDERHVSYVSLLFPVMGTLIDMDRHGCRAGEKYPLLDLARRQIIRAADHELVSVEVGADGRIGTRLRIPPGAGRV